MKLENKPIISIIIPCYNASKYIKENILLLNEQTLKNTQFIFINDGSNDETEKIIKDTLNYTNIRYKLINQNNKGVSAARNNGLNNCDGKYILFLDSDDIIEKDMLEIMVNKAEEQQLDMIFCGYDYLDEFGQFYKSYESRFKYIYNTINGKEALKFMMENEIHLWTGSVIYLREFLIDNKLGYYEGCNYGEDFEFICKCIFKAKRISSVDRVLAHYFQRRESLSNTFGINNFQSLGAMNRLKWYLRFNNADLNLIKLAEDIFNLEILVIYNRYIIKSKYDLYVESIFDIAYIKYKDRIKSYKLKAFNKERLKRYILIKIFILNKKLYTYFMKKNHKVN